MALAMIAPCGEGSESGRDVGLGERDNGGGLEDQLRGGLVLSSRGERRVLFRQGNPNGMGWGLIRDRGIECER